MSPLRTSRCSSGDRLVSVLRSNDSRRTSPSLRVTENVGRSPLPRSRRLLKSFPSLVACQPLGTIAELLQIAIHLAVDLFQFSFQCLPFCKNAIQVDFLLLFERIDVTRNVQVVVVPLDFLDRSQMGVFFYVLPSLVRRDDFPDVLLGELVLIFTVYVFPAAVN